MGIGRRIEAPVIESAGRAMGPTTAFHQRPQSDSESRCTRAGEEISAMIAGLLSMMREDDCLGVGNPDQIVEHMIGGLPLMPA